MTKKAVIILSGGLDSTTLLYDLIDQGFSPDVLTFDYGQKLVKELWFAKQTCDKLGLGDKHHIINLVSLNRIALSALTSRLIPIPDGEYTDKGMAVTVVPNRNMIMLSIAMSYAQSRRIPDIYIGAHGGDDINYPDCRPEFFSRMNQVAAISDDYPTKINTPYLNWSKSDIIGKGLKLNVDYSLTWSCYRGQEFACGTCASCRARLASFEDNNLLDPIKYQSHKKV